LEKYTIQDGELHVLVMYTLYQVLLYRSNARLTSYCLVCKVYIVFAIIQGASALFLTTLIDRI